MAKGESVGGLFLRLGLSYDDLNQDFVNVEHTISENVQRLNRESKLIRLKTEIDLTGVTSAADKLKIQQQALTQQVELQIQKVRLYEASWKEAAQANGQASKQAQNSAIALKQQELALAKLQQQLKAVATQQQELAKSSVSNSGGLLGSYNGIKGDVTGSIGKLTGAFQGLKDASGSADGAITKTLEIIDAIPSPAGKAVAALAAIPLVVKGIENSLLDMAKPAMSSGDALYAMSRGMQMSLADTAKLATICKVTGIELSEVAATTRRVTTAFVKSDEKATLMKQTLQRYGVEVRNTNGELKNTLELSIALANGLAKAQAEGRGKDFIAAVFGRFYSGDYITYLEDLAGNMALSAKIVKHGLADPAFAHAVQGEMNALNAQAEQLHGAWAYAMLPVANDIIPRVREQLGELTKVVADNKDGIKAFGSAIADIIGVIGGIATKATSAVIKLVGALGELTPNAQTNRTVEKYLNDDRIKTLEDFVNAELQRNYTYTERISIESNPALYQQTLSHYQPMFKALEEAREEVKKKNEEIKKSLSWSDFKKANDTFLADEEIEKSLERIAKYADEVAHIKIDLQFGNDSYGKALAELNLENEKAAKQAEGFLQEQAALSEWYGLKRTQIEQRHAEEIAKVREESIKRANDLIREAADTEYSLTHNAFEKQLYDIERWKQAQLEKAQTAEEVAATIADAAMKEAEAFKNAIDQMESAIRRVQDDIARKTMSQRDYDYYTAQQKYHEYLKELPKSVADEWFQIEMARIGRKAAEEEERYRRAQADEDERIRQARERGSDVERRAIENPYTKSPGLGRSPLVNADPRAVAAMGILEKYGVSANELKKALGGTATAQEAYQNILQRLTSEMNEAAGELGSVSTEASDGVSSLGDAASESAKTMTSAAETLRLAFEYLAEIEEENARSAREFSQPNDESGRIPITYGNEDDDYSIPPENRIEIIYGNEDDVPLSTFKEPTQTAAEMIRDYSKEHYRPGSFDLSDDGQSGTFHSHYPSSETPANDTQSSTATEKFQQQVQQATSNIADNAKAIQNLASTAENASMSANDFAERLNQTADTLDALREKIENLPVQPLPQQPPQEQPPQYDSFSDAFQKSLESITLDGLATFQSEIELLGTGMEAMANTAQTLRDLANAQLQTPPQPSQPQPNLPAATSVDLSGIQQTLTEISQTLNTVAQEPPIDLNPLQEALQQLSPALAEINTSIQGMSTELSAKLGEVAQGISAMAQSISASQNRQPPQVNVNVNPNINLGGAYVFDNAMKRQLTDDITTEVANAVTSAVQTATNQASYGYGN